MLQRSDMVHTKPLRLAIVTTSMHASDASDEATRDEAGRVRDLIRGLEAAGHRVDAVLAADPSLAPRLASIEPDVLIVDAESGARDAIEHVVVATRDAPRPIVLFTEEHDPDHVREALAAGVVAYVVAGLASERVRPVLDVAIARFEHEREMRQQLEVARDRLASMDVVASAKEALMRRHGLSEPEAYARLRRASMDQGLPMREVARRLLDGRHERSAQGMRSDADDLGTH
jgi:two-component system, response regulator / RNA-binding antiterminator